MNGLKTSFAGLELRNPIVAASCGGTNSAKKNLALEQAGVGAIVIKSIFEEDIVRATEKLSAENSYGEAADYLHGYMRSEALSDYLKIIRESKQCCSVPIIASINCFSDGEWGAFSELIQEAGADALEINMMEIQCKTSCEDGEWETKHLEVAKMITSKITIPVVMKLGANLTNPVALISKLHSCGVKGVVLFNRMYQNEIDIENLSFVQGNILSSKESLANQLRWVALSSSAVPQISCALSGGVQSGEDVVKAILAGASAVQVCSSLYREGNGWIATALSFVEQWQQRHQMESIDSARGRMNGSESREREHLMRTQFLKNFGTYKL